MKLLTATSTGQGKRYNDFHWATEGELVWYTAPCATDRRKPDGRCGCGRAFFGLSSHRATTTAQVRDLPVTGDDLVTALSGYYVSAGYGVVPRSELDPEIDEMATFAAELDVGTIVERRLDVFRRRAA